MTSKKYLSIVIVWVSAETDPKTSIRVQIIYSRGGGNTGEVWVGGGGRGEGRQGMEGRFEEVCSQANYQGSSRKCPRVTTPKK